ncbi:helix-turn-helix transcriptional regulator [Streptomyces sp. NBC_00885]|uniref:winged helix-turn-helix transcriptional regulator n=1 Tax=Streptomyces sp. NBC_00885 TaxID=2975857 RepID=UPI0038673369|nr:helix-turn-helix transcriptional regulator [Streptomyces sp. NBC_00885]
MSINRTSPEDPDETRNLAADPAHHDIVARCIQGISEKMLAQTLRALVQDGLVWREVKPTPPPQVTYGLTEFGREVGEPLTELFDRITQRLSPRSPG